MNIKIDFWEVASEYGNVSGSWC